MRVRLIDDGAQFAANELIDKRTAKWLEPKPRYPDVDDAQLQAYLAAKRTGEPRLTRLLRPFSVAREGNAGHAIRKLSSE